MSEYVSIIEERNLSLSIFGVIEAFMDLSGESTMPFIKKNTGLGSFASTPARAIFIGRTQELLFFVQHILKPEEPAHNMLSIWGQGGVGKTTLLRQFKNQAETADLTSRGSV